MTKGWVYCPVTKSIIITDRELLEVINNVAVKHMRSMNFSDVNIDVTNII